MMIHKDLDVWKKSRELVSDIYRATESFPQKELFGLTNQIRRAAVSIPSNIAEGAARESNKEFIHFLYIALGSLAELETQLIIATDLKFLEQGTVEEMMKEINTVGKLLNGLIRYRKSKLQ